MFATTARKPAVLIGVALAVVAAVVGGAILFTSSKASGVDLTSAKLVPADASLYVGMNTDLSSSQWVAAFDLVKRLGQKDPQQALKDAAEAGGDVKWEDDVAPFLGGDASFFMRGGGVGELASGGRNFDGAVIFKCNDTAKALDVIRKRAGTRLEARSYDGTAYFADESSPGFAAIIGDHLVVAGTESALKAVIDVAHGKAASLAANADFIALRNDLTNNFLGFEYVDLQQIIDKTLLSDPAIRKVLQQVGSDSLVLHPIGGAITASDAGFAFQAASKSDNAINPGARPRTSKLASRVPANALFFMSTAGVAQAWQDALTGDTRKQLDKTLNDEGSPLTVDEFLKEAGQELGLGSLDEIMKLLSGETALVAWQDAGEKTQGAVLAEVANEAEAKAVLAKLAASGKATRVRTVAVNGTEMPVFRDSGGDESAYAVAGGVAIFGTAAGLQTILEGKGENLSGSKAYTHSVAGLGTSLGSFMFFNLHEALGSSLGGLVGVGGDPALDALEGFMLNFVNEKGLARVSGVVSIAK